MAGGIQFDRRSIKSLGINDKATLNALLDDGIYTIGDLQRRLVREGKIYMVGARRLAYLQDKLRAQGLLAERPWTDRFYEKVYGRSARPHYHVLSVEGEVLLAQKLTEWLHNQDNVPHSDARADPLYVFCARMGCGRIRRRDPGSFDKYGEYILKPNADKRYDDVVLGPGKIAEICGIELKEVNLIYQRCLSFLRSKAISAEVKLIFNEYSERRK